MTVLFVGTPAAHLRAHPPTHSPALLYTCPLVTHLSCTAYTSQPTRPPLMPLTLFIYFHTPSQPTHPLHTPSIPLIYSPYTPPPPLIYFHTPISQFHHSSHTPTPAPLNHSTTVQSPIPISSIPPIHHPPSIHLSARTVPHYPHPSSSTLPQQPVNLPFHFPTFT